MKAVLTKSIATTRKNILILVNSKISLRNGVKYKKYSPAKFTNFISLGITHDIFATDFS
mgnify:CR=1 FL=1